MTASKRAFDIVVSGLGLVVLSPLLVLVAISIKLDDRGPILFRQSRVGRGGSLFSIVKFRTMVVDAESRGGQLTVGADRRVTRIGGFLRSYKIDELPQLWNVLRGQMSLVGPRPEVPSFVAHYTSDQRRVLALVPGITDPAAVKYRNEAEMLAHSSEPEWTYRTEIMPEKIHMNLEYAESANFLSDLWQITLTLLSLIRRSG